MDGIAQATRQELDDLFSGRSKEKEAIKQWFTTQLHLYGRNPFQKVGPQVGPEGRVGKGVS
jgi:hypothetical protein